MTKTRFTIDHLRATASIFGPTPSVGPMLIQAAEDAEVLDRLSQEFAVDSPEYLALEKRIALIREEIASRTPAD